MSVAVAPLNDTIYTALKAFLMAALPVTSDAVVKGLGNRVAPPNAANWIVMQAMATARLSTNTLAWDETNPTPTTLTHTEGVKLEVQFDVYGPLALDWATIISMLWRDEFGCEQLASLGAPLYSDTPMQAPLTTGEEQYLQRFTVRAFLQYNASVVTPQEFAASLQVGLINVDVSYPD